VSEQAFSHQFTAFLFVSQPLSSDSAIHDVGTHAD
jgi:hypothetical protein